MRSGQEYTASGLSLGICRAQLKLPMVSNGGLFTFKSASRLTLTKYKQFIDESVEICDKKENCLCDLRSRRVKFRRVKKLFGGQFCQSLN